MAERLLQIRDRVGKEALLELHRRGIQINPFVLGQHHHCLEVAMRRIVAYQIPVAAAEGALRVAYWDRMHDFLGRSPVPRTLPLDVGAPLKDVASVLVVGVTDEAPGGLLARQESAIEDIRRILHWAMGHGRFDMICFPRVPLVAVPASTTNLLLGLAAEYRTVIQIGWYDAAGNAGDRVVLHVPAGKSAASVVQKKLFSDATPPHTTGHGAIHELSIAATAVGNVCTLIGDDAAHESVRDLVCRHAREGAGIDIILNVADAQTEPPPALSRLCADADAVGLWIQRGARSVLYLPTAPERLGLPVEGGDALAGIHLESFEIHLASMRRLRRARVTRDAVPGRLSNGVSLTRWDSSPAVGRSVEALRGEIASLAAHVKPTAPGGTPPAAPDLELRTSLEQITRVLAALGTSVSELAQSGRATAESTTSALREVTHHVARLEAAAGTEKATTRSDVGALADAIKDLRSAVLTQRPPAETRATVDALARLDERVRDLPAAVKASIATSSASLAPAPPRDAADGLRGMDALLRRLEQLEGSVREQIERMSAAESQDEAALQAVIRKLGAN